MKKSTVVEHGKRPGIADNPDCFGVADSKQYVSLYYFLSDKLACSQLASLTWGKITYPKSKTIINFDLNPWQYMK